LIVRGDLYWNARNIDTGTCGVCDEPISLGQPVKHYRNSDAWPNTVRHADKACYEIEAMRQVSSDQAPVLVP